MTRQEYIDFISNVLSPIDKTNRFHKENIRVACDFVYAEKMAQVLDSAELDLFTKEYLAQDVTLDASRDLYYMDLPAAIIPIPRISSGIQYINTNQGMALDFCPTTEREMYYIDGSVTQLVDTTIGYWIQGTKVWFDNSMTPAIATAGVRVILIPRFSEFDKDDIVQIPNCTSMQFVQEVIQLIAPSAPVDLKANNAG